MKNLVHRTVAASFARAAGDRTYTVTLSTARPDRENDRIPVEGWIIPRRVPLLWAHQPTELPLGRTRGVHAAGEALRGEIEFPPATVYPFADQVVRLIDTGFLDSVSVGFRAIDKPERNDLGGVDFVGRKELYELSVVNVPANVGARIDRMDEAAMRKWLGDGGEVVLELVDDPVVLTLVDEPADEPVLVLADAPADDDVVLSLADEGLVGAIRRIVRERLAYHRGRI